MTLIPMDPETQNRVGDKRPQGVVTPLAQVRGADLQPAAVEIEEGDGRVAVKVGDVLIHRSPSRVSASLRYLLAGGDLPNRFSVTSSIHGEGVSAVSRSLASLIAHDWRIPTCWVDLNWWKVGSPKFEQNLFPVTIADVLTGTGRIEDLPTSTSIRGLEMVTAGRLPISSRSIVAKSEGLAEVVEALARRFDYLIFDLPPVLASSDTITLGTLGEGYLLVVRQRATSSAQVTAALKAMNAVPCLGTVLNGVRSRLPRFLSPSSDVWALGGNG